MAHIISVRGMDDSILLRKLMLRLKTNERFKSADSPKSVVYHGGGFDLLQFFNALKNPEITFYEIDRGPTQACKIEEIKKYARANNIQIEEIEKYTKIGNMYFVHADLSKYS